MTEENDFLDEFEPETAPEPETPEPEPVEAEEPQEPEPEEESTGEKEDAPPASVESQSPDKGILAAMHAERERRQALERELEELKKPQEPSTPPDVFEDQEGFTNHLQSSIEQRLLNDRLNQSEFFAAREFGKEKVEEYRTRFLEVAKTDQALYQQVMKSPSPYHSMVEAMDRLDTAQKLEDPQYVDKLIGEKVAAREAEIEARIRKEYEEKFAASRIPPSGARAGSKGTDTPIDKGDAFDAAFG